MNLRDSVANNFRIMNPKDFWPRCEFDIPNHPEDIGLSEVVRLRQRGRGHLDDVNVERDCLEGQLGR